MRLSRWLPLVSLVVAICAFLGVYVLVIGRFPIRFTDTHELATVFYEVPDKAFINKPVTITVKLTSKDKPVNAVGMYLRFNPDYLQLTSLDTAASFCQFYPEKKYDNQLGTISLSCGSPHPGFKGETTIMSLTFTPKQPGTTLIYTDSTSQILASDGRGTNILTEYPQIPVTIFNDL